MQEIQDLIRRELTHAMVTAAHAERISLHGEAIALDSSSQLSVVNAPVAGIEQIEFKAMLEGCPDLVNRPIMYWHVSGDLLKTRAFPFGEGFYTIVAQQQRGIAEMKDVKGRTVAEGDLRVCIGPEGSPPGVSARKISGGIDSATGSLWPPHIKVCGHVKIQQSGVTVTVKVCVEAGF